MKIRAITDQDIPDITSIYNYYIENTLVSYEEKCLSEKHMATRVKRVIDAGFPWLVADEQGTVSGYCYGYQWSPRTAYRHTAEVTIYLKHTATGHGMGTQLYQVLFAALKAMQIKTVIGGIGFPNPASVALHQKLGMKKVAHFEEVGYKFGQWLDVGYWQGELATVTASPVQPGRNRESHD